MKVMTTTVSFLTLLGIYSDDVNVITVGQVLRWICFCSSSLFIAIPQTIFLFMEASSSIDIAFVIYMCSVMIGGGMQLIYMIVYRRRIMNFVESLERFIGVKMRLNIDNKFAETERLVTRLSEGFRNLVTVNAAIYCLVPGAQQLYAYMTDNVTPKTYLAPFRDMYYFWDATKSPMFEICYAVFTIFIFIFIVFFITVAIFFIGICLHIVGLYDDLMDTFRKIDGFPPTERYARITYCIKYHYDIIDFITAANSFFSEVIFIEFCYSLTSIATCVLTGSYAGLLNLAVVIPNIMCFAGALFLFCFTGSMVLDQADRLQLEAYSIGWYDYTMREKRMLIPLMARTLRPCGMSAFGYYYCDNETFSGIMSNVFSAFAFLRNVV